MILPTTDVSLQTSHAVHMHTGQSSGIFKFVEVLQAVPTAIRIVESPFHNS